MDIISDNISKMDTKQLLELKNKITMELNRRTVDDDKKSVMRIAAIAALRKEYGYGLKEAMDEVDRLTFSRLKRDPDLGAKDRILDADPHRQWKRWQPDEDM